jgi:phage protein D
MAADYKQIYKGRDLRVPAFDVKVDGKDLPAFAARDIISARYSDSIDKIDSFELTVNNWDAQKRDFKYTGPGRTAGEPSRQFEPGSPIELWMGYFRPTAPAYADPEDPAPLRLMLAGVITSIAPSFPAAGQPTLKVSGQNVLRLLQAKPNTRTFVKMTDSAIAEDIGKKGAWKIGSLDVTVKTDPEAKKNEVVIDELLQDNQFDIVFLLERAFTIGYDVILQHEGTAEQTKLFLYFGPSKAEKRQKYLLEWGRSLIQFDPTLTTTRQIKQVTVRYWNGVKKVMETVTVKRGELDVKSLRDDTILKRLEAGFAESEDIICTRPFRDKQAAKAHATALLGEVVKRFVTGKGSTFGTPDLRAGSMLQIDGLGAIFTGHYFVTSSTHSIGAGGYVTEFECRLEEPNT